MMKLLEMSIRTHLWLIRSNEKQNKARYIKQLKNDIQLYRVYKSYLTRFYSEKTKTMIM